MSKSKAELKFRFLRHDNIGTADADQDKKFLSESFVDTGELLILADTIDPRFIVVGRTGAGKTALLNRLAETEDRVIKIAPEELALTYLSDNSVISFFMDLDIKMDLFYNLLWRHVFTVEILKERYEIINEKKRDDFLTKIREAFGIERNRAKRDALDYLSEWGETFWQTTEYRIKEITTSLEDDFRSQVKASGSSNLAQFLSTTAELNAEAVKSLSEEQKAEISHIGQRVVNKVQIKKLSDVMRALDEDILIDKQKKYFITIDKLDENWINDELRYYLLASLLETAKDFNHKVENAKVVVALREDLLGRIFRFARGTGHQEEKFKDLYVPLNWRKQDLIKLLDRRVSQLIREQYTQRAVSLKDILPTYVRVNRSRCEPTEYIIQRTMLRPRDVIMFFNECIKAAEGKAKIAQTNIFQAEEHYSKSRLRALADEWYSDYQHLVEMCLFFRRYPRKFNFKDVQREKFKDDILNFCIDFAGSEDEIYQLVSGKLSDERLDELLAEILRILFKVGFLGAKTESYLPVEWSYEGKKLKSIEIGDDTVFEIHAAFWRELGIKPE